MTNRPTVVCEDNGDNGSGTIRRTVRIVNPLGIHPRVADRFSRSARTFTCDVTVWNGETRADGKSVIDLILLVALPGSDVILEVAGADAAAAIEPLAAILGAADGEDYAI